MGQPPISEEMKAWATALAAETVEWPRLSQRSFFGFTALYRGENIFAMLPRSRNLESANTIAFKFETPPNHLRDRLASDRRIGSIQQENSRWHTFLLSSNTDLHDALHWLGEAYTAAGKRKKSK
jgi:hypothetical protein